MKRYFGGWMDATIAFLLIPLLCIFSLAFSIFMFIEEGITIASCFISLWCIVSILLLFLMIKPIYKSIYTWGKLEERGMQVKTLGHRECLVEYSKFTYVGIGCYLHGGPSRSGGFIIRYIYFSDEFVPERYKININLWKMDENKLRIGFTEERYEYLLKVLPFKQAHMLRSDYLMLCKK